ncbi:MAG: ParA family protein [Lachnospiraceae bacterium]|nr:ParA family protein [Lachnospiraceae bacterium]
MNERTFNIICGHYGCGKSNYSINLALDMAGKGRKVMLVDLDLVNPYFLSSGYKDMLEENGIQVIAPLFANTNVETPALPADLNLMFETDRDVVLDLGGDDAGAVVLGRYASQISAIDYKMTYLVNKYRNLTSEVDDTVEILKEIEAASRCHATEVINNSHLKKESTLAIIEESIPYAKEVAEKLGLPFIGTTIPLFLLEDEKTKEKIESSDEVFFPIDIYVKAPWE